MTPMESAVVVTIRIRPAPGERWTQSDARNIASGVVSFTEDWCDNNNRRAEIESTWAIYEEAEE